MNEYKWQLVLEDKAVSINWRSFSRGGARIYLEGRSRFGTSFIYSLDF